MSMKTQERIVIDSQTCHGKPRVRGTRVMVSNILSLLAGGYTVKQVLEYYPDLVEEDVTSAIAYAARVLDEQVVFTS